MPLLLLLPLLVLAVLALWAVLLPFSLWARYRTGKARRRAVAWVVGGNAWLLLLSCGLFLAGAAISQLWLAHPLRDAGLGLLAGGALAVASLRLTRFERTGAELWYTPNRWLVLALTVLIALRLVAGFVVAWRRAFGDAAIGGHALWDTGGLMAVAGLLLGYWLVYTWGVRGRLRRMRTAVSPSPN
jgi:hypothetical protein